MENAVILSACRTPIGSFQGSLKGLTAPQLGSIAVKEAINRAGIEPGILDEVIMGIILPAGMGQNPARQAAISAGVPHSVGALTVNKVCGSGMKSIMIAATNIKAGEYNAAVAGGMESMTNAPYLLPQGRVGYRLGDGKVVDSMVLDGLWDVYNNYHMGMTGEVIAEKYNVSREQQDEYALESYNKALKATEAGHFKDEIVPVPVPQRRGPPSLVDTDEHPRIEIDTDGKVQLTTSAETLAKLRPAFRAGGTVTAGSASGINDGAAALLLMSRAKARELGLEPLARWVASAVAGVNPRTMGYGPIPATRKVLSRTGLTIDDMDLVELNEAFAIQALACIKELGLDVAKVNVNGGAVALGHPLGCTGARLMVTLLHEMRRRAAAGERMRYGLATMCVGVGQGGATIVERRG